MIHALLVLNDELLVAETIVRVEPYADDGYAVVLRRGVAQLFAYLFTVRDLRARLSGKSADLALRTALDLDAVEPTPTRQLSAGTAAVGETTLVLLDGERVAGVLEPPTAPEERVEEDEPESWQGRETVGFRGGQKSERQAAQIVRVYYGTDRSPEADVSVDPYYGGGRGALVFGTADVSIPTDRAKGTIPRPAWWRFEFKENPARHAMVTRVGQIDKALFVEELRATFQRTARKHALLFVHGYNVTFPEALRRTAQLAFDLRIDNTPEFPGVPLLYSWPSQGRFLGYLTDETNIAWTRPKFEQFLRVALCEIGADVVHVIAHSMGNRALIECLTTFNTADLPMGSAVLDQVVFAAPDFDAGTFRDLSHTLAGRARRYTLYASSGDQALKVSRELRSELARLGDSGEDIVVVDGVDTIDASSVETDLLGHGYFGERTVLGDIFYLLKDGSAPGQRYGLRPHKHSTLRYWEFEP